MRRYTKNRKKRLLPRLAVITSTILVSAGITLAILELTNITHLLDKPHIVSPSPNSSSQNTKGEPADTTQDIKQPVDSTSGQNLPLLEPTGSFVSSHHLSLGNSTQVQSSCQTTPGATCKISFIKGDTTKELPSQKTDSSGAVYWAWKPQDVGLSTGEWKIQATSVLDGNNKTAYDSVVLEVAQ